MAEYLINLTLVWLGFAPAFLGLALVFFGLRLFLRMWHEDFDPARRDMTAKYINRVTAGAFIALSILSVIVSATSSAITYKHQPYEKEPSAYSQPIERKPVVDNTRQPKMNEAERAERFNSLTDYTNKEQ